MPYKTRPYFKNKYVPDLTREYVITPEFLTASSALGGDGNFTVSLPPADVQRIQNPWGKFRDIGDVVITPNGGTAKTCTNVSGVKAFVEALYGRHPAVTAERGAQHTAQQPWYEGLSKDDLSDQAICLEPLPEIINHLLWAEKARPSEKTEGLVGQWHRKGERVYQSDMLPIVAPTEGQFRGAFTVAYNEGYREFMSRYGYKKVSDVAGFYVSREGAHTNFKLADIYGLDTLQSRIEPYIKGKTLPGQYKGDEEFRARLAEKYEYMMTRDLKVVPVSALPQFHAPLEARFFASGTKAQDFLAPNPYAAPDHSGGVS